MDWKAELERCVKTLAQPASVQISLFPESVVIGDELVLELDEAFRRWRDNGYPMSIAEAASMAILDEYIESLSGPQEDGFWDDPSMLFTDPRWERIRELAKSVLQAFGWPFEIPERNNAVYVSSAGITNNS